jgi:hypothetical protein
MVYSSITYGLIFWENPCYSHIIFRLQKEKAIRTIMGIRDGDSYRKHFRELKIVPLKSQYIQGVPGGMYQTLGGCSLC